MAEDDQFAVDTSVSPGRVLGGEAKDESADLVRCRWSSWSSRGLCPVFGDASLPSQQGVGCDDPASSCLARECGGDGTKESSVVVGEFCRSICRRSTPSWWRNTMSSRSLDRPERTERWARAAMRR
jgi:hypothetical protein